MYEDEEDDDVWEVEPTGFQQDEEIDRFGVGKWMFPDGTSKYGPGETKAAKLVAEGGWGYDSKGILRPPGYEDPEAEVEAPVAEEPVAEVEPPAQTEEAEETEEEKPLPAPEVVPPSGGPSFAEKAASAAGLRPGSFATKNEESSSRTVSGALPEHMQREQTDRLRQAGDEYVQAIDDQRFREASRKAARAADAMEKGKLKELEGASQLKQQREREAKAKTRAKEVSETEINPRRAWDDAGGFNKVMGGMAVFLSGVSAYMRGGQNSALQNIKDTLEADTKAQLADRDSQVAYWTRELGDARAGIAAADLKKWQGIEKQLEANLLDEQSQETLERGAVLMKQVRLELTGKLNELEKANYGNEVRQEQAARSEQAGYAPPAPRGGASAEDTALKALRLDKAMEEQGYTREQRAAALQAMGFAPPGGKTAAEFGREKDAAAADGNGKYTEVEGKAVSARDTMQAFGLKAGLRRNKDTGLWEPNDEGIVPPGFIESINPFDDGDIMAHGEAAAEAFGRLQSGGVIGDDERPQFRTQAGLNTRNRKQLASQLNATEVIIRGKLPKDQREQPKAAPAEWKKPAKDSKDSE